MLRTGRSDVVICLMPDWPIGHIMGEFLRRISGGLAEHGITHQPGGAARPTSQIWQAITPAAVIGFEECDESERQAMLAAGIEVAVFFFGGAHRRNDLLPEEPTGRSQAEYLAEAGHRRLGYAYPDDPTLRIFAEPRLAGVHTTCAELGLNEPLVHTVPFEPDAAARAVQAWRAADPPVTGVCAYNDEVALAVLAGLRLLGLQAPRDLAVIGVDDIPLARLATPTLTTVEIDIAAASMHVVNTVLRALAGKPRPRALKSTVRRVIIRETT